tara:strand:- start:181 stop:372 length:192 start_codon:yes stop_codon:yes gene_type:complete
MKILKKNTTKCDRCGEPINKEKDKAYCFHTEDSEVYICVPCVRDVYHEFVKHNGDGKIIPDEE